MPQRALPAVFMRGGTSKGVFLRESDLPAAGPERDALILELLGSPDPMQIDGLGGTFSSTSKVMAVSRSTRPGCDVDYLFAQGAVTRPVVDYRGNCGNLTSAVGVYAIDEGLVEELSEPVTTVVLYNKNTGVRVRAHIPVRRGRAAVQGDHRIAGVPRPGAKIINEYLDPAGSVLGALYPTGQPKESVETPEGAVDVSIVDVANPVAFVRAGDVGLLGDEVPAEVNAQPALLERLESIRAACAVRLGLAEHAGEAADVSPSLPMLALVSSPRAYRTSLGEDVDAHEMDVRARAMSMQQMHHAYPMTVLMCTAAAARLPGTVVSELATCHGEEVRIGHAKGVAAAAARLDPSSGAQPRIESVSVTRTARRLMAGEVYVRADASGAHDADHRS